MQKKLYLSSILIFMGSIVIVLYALYVLQQLSAAIGVSSGVVAVVKSYNLTATNSLTAIANSFPVLTSGLYMDYAAFSLAIIIFALSTMNLFQSRLRRLGSITLILAAFACLVPITVLDISVISESIYALAIIYIAAMLVLLPSLYDMLSDYSPKQKKSPKNIEVNPLTPYTNMLKLSSELASGLSGSIEILDMHFDSAGLKNLSLMISGNEQNYKEIRVLARKERFDPKFIKECRDFKEEMLNKGITFDVRLMNEEDASMQHERLLIDDNSAYKIPPLNIINKKSEHIVRISRRESEKRFSYIWSRATKLENLQQ